MNDASESGAAKMWVVAERRVMWSWGENVG